MQKTIGIVFDFDGTLAPDSTSSFLESIGVDVASFWTRANTRIAEEGWDPIPVYLYQLLELAHDPAHGITITREMFQRHGATIKTFPGVSTLFSRFRAHAEEIDPSYRLEFYLISSGIGDILRHTRIAKHFEYIWACEFAYKPDGSLLFPKNVISSNEKTRFLFHISKGFSAETSRTDPAKVNVKVVDRQYRIPFKRMIYVGDGYTDIPCFALLKKNQGVAFGVYEREQSRKWTQAWGFVQDERVTSLLPAEFGKNSPLEDHVKMAIRGIIQSNE